MATVNSDFITRGSAKIGHGSSGPFSLKTQGTTFNLVNDTATTLNIGGAATALALGAATGTASINNATVTLGNATAFNINGANPTIASSSTGTLTLFDTNLLTVDAFSAATAIRIGANSGTFTVDNATFTLTNASTVNVNGANPVIASSATGTLSLFNTNITTVNEFGAATTITIGNTTTAAQTITIGGSSTATGSTYNFGSGATINGATKTINIGTNGVAGSITNINIGSSAATANNSTMTVYAKTIIKGDLQVDGTTTTINSTVTSVDDPIFILGGDTAPAADDNLDRGIEFRWHNGSVAKLGFFGYDDSTGYFVFVPDATDTSSVISGTPGDIQATNFRGALVGNADTATTLANTRTLWGQNFNGSANVTGSLTSVGDITGSGAVNITSGAATQITLDSGTTGAVNVGTSANAKTVTIGNVTGATAVVVNAGSGGIALKTLTVAGVVTTSAAGVVSSEAQLAIARGGTNGTATPTAGAVAYGTGTAYAFSLAGTTGMALLSGGTGAPTWGTLGVTYGGTGVNGSAAANGSLLIGNGTGYTLATLTQGTGMTITNGAGSISLAVASVPNSMTLRFDGGTTEGTDQYVFNGSAAKTINFIAGTNVTLSKAAGAITVNANISTLDMTNAAVNSDTVTITANATPTTLDSFAVATYTAAEYLIQMKQGTKITTTKVLVQWDGTDVSLTEYAVIDAAAGAANATLTATHATGTITVSASSSDAATTNVVIKSAVTYIKA